MGLAQSEVGLEVKDLLELLKELDSGGLNLHNREARQNVATRVNMQKMWGHQWIYNDMANQSKN